MDSEVLRVPLTEFVRVVGLKKMLPTPVTRVSIIVIVAAS